MGSDSKSQSLHVKPEFPEELKKQMVEKLQKKHGAKNSRLRAGGCIIFIREPIANFKRYSGAGEEGLKVLRRAIRGDISSLHRSASRIEGVR